VKSICSVLNVEDKTRSLARKASFRCRSSAKLFGKALSLLARQSSTRLAEAAFWEESEWAKQTGEELFVCPLARFYFFSASNSRRRM